MSLKFITLFSFVFFRLKLPLLSLNILYFIFYSCHVSAPFSSLSSFGHPLLLEELKQGNIIHIGHDLISSSFLLTYYVKCHRSVIQNSPISNTVKYKRLIYFVVDNKSTNYLFSKIPYTIIKCN